MFILFNDNYDYINIYTYINIFSVNNILINGVVLIHPILMYMTYILCLALLSFFQKQFFYKIFNIKKNKSKFILISFGSLVLGSF